jgi:hypothetical protein
MPSTVLEHIKGEEVTKRLAEALELDPGGTYRVTVQIEDEALANATSLYERAIFSNDSSRTPCLRTHPSRSWRAATREATSS